MLNTLVVCFTRQLMVLGWWRTAHRSLVRCLCKSQALKTPLKNPKKTFQKHLAQQDLLTFFLHGCHLMRNKRFTDHVKGKKSPVRQNQKNKDASGHNSIY